MTRQTRVVSAHWIVGVDGSDPSLVALRWAVQHAPIHDARLTAVNVFHVPAVMALFTAKRGLGVDELGLAATAGHDLDVAVERVDPAVPVTPLVVEGAAAQELVDIASEADALIVGRTGSGELRRHRLGSVARYCATHSTVPVVTVPERWNPHPLGRVVVGFDGSSNAAAALRWALGFSGPEVTVRVVCAMEVAPWLGARATRQQFPEEVANEEQNLHDALDAVDPGRRAERMLVLDAPRTALETAGRDADLVVVGARGRGVIASELLGSVSTSLLHDVGAVVAVVPDSN